MLTIIFYQFWKATISNAILQLASSWLKYIAGPRLESYFISILSISVQHNLFRQQKADTNHTQMLNQQNQFISPNHGMYHYGYSHVGDIVMLVTYSCWQF